MEAGKKEQTFPLPPGVVYPNRALILILMFQAEVVRFKPFEGQCCCNATPLLVLVLIMESFFAKSAVCLTNARVIIV